MTQQTDLFRSVGQRDPLSLLGPETSIEGVGLVDHDRQHISAVVWPADAAPDPSTGLGYFFVWVLSTDGVWRELGKKRTRREWTGGSSSVDGTKKAIRRDWVERFITRFYPRWRELEWSATDVEPIHYNIALYGSEHESFERVVLGK